MALLPSDAEEFAQYMMTLQKDVALCRRMGECARQTIEEQFSMKHLVNEFGQIVRG